MVLKRGCKFFNKNYAQNGLIITPDRQQWKMLVLSMNVDKKSLETEFSIAICCQNGDKLQLKTLFPAIFDPHSSIVKRL